MGKLLSRAFLVLLATLGLLLVSTQPGVAASPSWLLSADSPTAEEALAQELKRDPHGRVVANRVYRPDGTVFIAVDAEVFSLGQCGAGQWCMWSQTNYQGSFSYRTGSGVVHNLSGTVRSVWNNRSTAARLFSNTGAASICYVAGQRAASLSASYITPQKVALHSGGC